MRLPDPASHLSPSQSRLLDRSLPASNPPMRRVRSSLPGASAVGDLARRVVGDAPERRTEPPPSLGRKTTPSGTSACAVHGREYRVVARRENLLLWVTLGPRCQCRDGASPETMAVTALRPRPDTSASCRSDAPA